MTNIEVSANANGSQYEMPHMADAAYGDLSRATYDVLGSSANGHELVSVSAPVVEGGRTIDGMRVVVAEGYLGSSAVQATLSHNQAVQEESGLQLEPVQTSRPAVSHDRFPQQLGGLGKSQRELSLQLLRYRQELEDGVVEANTTIKEGREQFLREQISKLESQLGSRENGS